MSRLGELTRKVDAFFARVAERHGTDMQCQTGCSDCCHVRLTITAVEAAAIRAHVAGWPRDRRRDLTAGGAGDLPRGIDRRSELARGGDPDGVAGAAGGLPRGIDRRSELARGGDPDGVAGAAGVLPRGITRCAALDPAGRCKIYDARPLVCRSHGVPIRLRRGALPVVQACHRNFTQTTPDPDCVLDQTTLSATLYAIDAAEARAAPPGSPRATEARSPSPALDPSPSVTGGEVAASPSGSEPGRRVDLAELLADLAAI